MCLVDKKLHLINKVTRWYWYTDIFRLCVLPYITHTKLQESSFEMLQTTDNETHKAARKTKYP